MKNKALKIALDFEADYMDNVQNYTLRELAEKFDLELRTSGDNLDLVEIINRCMFADLMCYEPFLKCPLIGHYIIDDEEHFAFAQVGIVECGKCKRQFPVYKAITVSEHGYGITEFIAYKEFCVKDSDMNTIYDVAKYLSDYYNALEAASLL